MYRKDNNLTSILRTKVELWENGKSDTKNALGQYAKADKLVKTLYAAVIPQTGALLTGRTAETVLTKTTHKLIIRYDSQVTSDQWFMVNGQRYDILYFIDPYENHERLEVFCESVLTK